MGPVDVASLGYRTDLAIRRAEGGQITDCGDHIVIRTGQNPGYWWGNFILLAAPPRAAELAGWLARFATLFPAARHRTLGVDGTDAAAVDPDVFTAAGFRAERSVVLTASSVRPARQPGLAATVRRLAGADDWRQSAELRRACGDPGESAAAAGDAAADVVRAGEQEFEAGSWPRGNGSPRPAGRPGSARSTAAASSRSLAWRGLVTGSRGTRTSRRTPNSGGKGSPGP